MSRPPPNPIEQRRGQFAKRPFAADCYETIDRARVLGEENAIAHRNATDAIPATGAVRDVAAQVTRIRSARKAADNAGVAFFINARCDLFFQGDAIPHDEALLAKVVDRAHAYAEAGGSGFIVPGLTNLSLIFQLAKKSPTPINILADSSTNLRQLADNGAARVSYGAAPYVEAMAALEQAARGISGFVAR